MAKCVCSVSMNKISNLPTPRSDNSKTFKDIRPIWSSTARQARSQQSRRHRRQILFHLLIIRQIPRSNAQQAPRLLRLAHLPRRHAGPIVNLADLLGSRNLHKHLVLTLGPIAIAIAIAQHGDADHLDGAHAPELGLGPVAQLEVGLADVGDEAHAQRHAHQAAVLVLEGAGPEGGLEVGFGPDVASAAFALDEDGGEAGFVLGDGVAVSALLQERVALVFERVRFFETDFRRLDGDRHRLAQALLDLGIVRARDIEFAEVFDGAEGEEEALLERIGHHWVFVGGCMWVAELQGQPEMGVELWEREISEEPHVGEEV